jgi:hypothetical protein
MKGPSDLKLDFIPKCIIIRKINEHAPLWVFRFHFRKKSLVSSGYLKAGTVRVYERRLSLWLKESLNGLMTVRATVSLSKKTVLMYLSIIQESMGPASRLSEKATGLLLT